MARGPLLRSVVVACSGIFGLGIAWCGVATSARAQTPPDRSPVLVVAHRGASKGAPEHTGAAYDAAVRAGADVLECDLQLTRDEQLVCLHDETVDRTTGGAHHGRVDTFTLAQLRAMDFGSWFGPRFSGAKIMTLEEQLTCYRGIDPTLQFYIETKAPATYGGRMEPVLVALLERTGLMPHGAPDVRSSPVIIQSFDAASLQVIRASAPSLPTAFLTTVGQQVVPPGTEDSQPDVYASISANWEAEPALVERVHSSGREAHTWTIDDPAQIERLVTAGIDGFFTNDPATGRRVVDAAGLGSGRKPRPAPASDAASAPGCPSGAGIGFVRAEAATTTTTTTGTSTAGAGAAAAPASDAGDGSSPVLAIAIGALVVAAIAGAVVWMRRRATA